MKWQSQIKAQFLLVCMVLGMLHNAIPHVHEPHLEGQKALGDSSPEALHEEVNDEVNFLAFLLEIHTQSDHSHEYTPATFELVKTLIHFDFTVLPEMNNTVHAVAANLESAVPYAPVNEHMPKPAFLNHWPLRGPPTAT